MKPHEETWEQQEFRPCRVTTGRDDVCQAETPDRARLIAAAPEMARALLLIRAALEQISNDDMTEELAEAQGEIGQVLTKAGVLP